MKVADEPAAVVHSLGPPPLHGRDAIAEHYFTLVYDRITMMAGAVAGAAGMIEVDDLFEQLDEDWDDSDDSDEDDDETWRGRGELTRSPARWRAISSSRLRL